MIVADLSSTQLRARLRGQGLRLRTGPLVNCIRSPLDDVARGIGLHYANHEVAPADGFADFHVSVERPATLRRWIAKQVLFRFDRESPFAPLPGDQGFPVLEWGLNWCVSAHCHQYLVLHAAVVARGDRALVMPATSGAGKSTLCAGLVYGGGWRLLSDELALVDADSGALHALARPISLKNDSIEVLARFAPAAHIGPVVEETQKGRVAHVRPPAPSASGPDTPARVRWVVLPRYEPGARARLVPISRARAFMRLVDQSFNYQVHGRRGFDLLAQMVSGCEAYEFVYSDLAEACEAFEGLGVGG